MKTEIKSKGPISDCPIGWLGPDELIIVMLQ